MSAGATETLDPWTAFAPNDFSRVTSLYDGLYGFDEELRVQPKLVEEDERNADGTQWTFRLRDGVTFHDGSPLQADDVIYNMRSWADPKSATNYTHVGFQLIADSLRKLDDRTVRVRLSKPNMALPQNMAFAYQHIKSRRDRKGSPIGTGPFKFVSFQPGSRSEFDANRDYWGEGGPYVDKLIIDSSYTDETARLNALVSGAVDVMPFLPFGQVGAAGSRFNVLRAESGCFQNFYMRTDSTPFSDVRVRQALRLAVDRQNMVDSVYSGVGSVSNDVPGRYDPMYDDSLKRERDLEQAKALLKQAGREGLTVTLRTSIAVSGLVEAATVFKQQMRDAGIKVELVRVDPSTYFDPTTNYGKMPFAQTTYFPVPNMQFVWNTSFSGGLSNPANETHWTNPKTASLLNQARAARDEGSAREAWRELQLQQFNEGGFINWGTHDLVDGVASKVQGLVPSKYMNASGFNFRLAWLNA